MERAAQSRDRRQILSVALLPILFMLPVMLVLALRVSAIHAAEQREERLDSIISQTHVVREQLAGMEAALRGYVLTGEPSFLAPYQQGRAHIKVALAAIEQEGGADPAFSGTVKELKEHIGDWFAYTSAAVASRRPVDTSEVRRAGIIDKSSMEEILADVGEILAAVSRERDATISGAEQRLRLEIVVVVLSALLAALATGFAVRRAMRITQEAEQERARLAEARRRAAELERENERVQTADRRKSQYVANMSHELRTPLTAMLGFSELLRDGKAGPVSDEQAEYLDYILKSGRHLLELIGTVLDLAKVESGKLDVAMAVVDPRAIARDVCEGMHELAGRKSLWMRLETHHSPERVFLDPARTRQIMYNYVSNAIKFTPNFGRVSVRLMADGPDGFRIEVEDNGVGIAPEHLAQLFTEFRQVDGDEAAARMGTGLGLALAKRLVEAQGGSVAVTSTVALGSVFSATFPTAVLAAREAAPAEMTRA